MAQELFLATSGASGPPPHEDEDVFEEDLEQDLPTPPTRRSKKRPKTTERCSTKRNLMAAFDSAPEELTPPQGMVRQI